MNGLVASQFDIMERINNGWKNYKKSPKERISESYIEVRLEQLEAVWIEFCINHKKLIESHLEELKSSSYVLKDIYNETQELYFGYKVDLKSAASKYKRVKPESEKEASRSLGAGTSTNVKLPKIVIPTFSGKYLEWVTFRDLFESLVHKNDSIDNVQKLHYLKGYLSGEAEQLLRQIPISESNYIKCWDLLKERYNNKRFICNTILKRFLSQKNATSESATFLKELIDTSNDCLSALVNIGIDVSTWDVIVIHLLTLKLDIESRRQWELSASGNTNLDELPTYERFKEFITKRFRALEFVESKKPVHNANNIANTPKPRALHVANKAQCPMCSDTHKIMFYKRFIKQDVDTRRSFVQDKGLCFNCLGGNHSAKFCQNSSTCRICKRRHHSLLHPKNSSEEGTSSANATGSYTSSVQGGNNSTSGEATGQPESVLIANNFASKGNDEVLLATALVGAQSRNGEYYTIRALLDQGSQASFVTEAMIQYLGLQKRPISGTISGLGGKNNVLSKSMVVLNLKSLVFPGIKLSVKAYVLKTITTLLPARKVVKLSGVDLLDMQLADPNYYTPNKIDILLGAEVFSQIIQEGVRKNDAGTLVAQSTSLGWVLSGIVNSSGDLPSKVVVFHSQVKEDEILKRFWELEADSSIGNGSISLSEEEKRCEELFAATTTRDSEGRYVVKLPIKYDHPSCIHGQSREISEKRFHGLETRLNKNKEFKIKYTEVIEEYLQMEHMEQVPENEKELESVYLPHHAVIRQDKDTTKLRVVFDASCKGKNGVSLNDNLLVGPTLQPDLRQLVLRWRTWPICLVADIVKMYRQVRVAHEDADLQRILWRTSIDVPLTEYRLLTVTFGTASAPYLAVKALQQVALDEGKEYPLAANRVLTDFYMDDLMTGCQNVKEGVKIYKETNEMLGKAGFVLQKWSSNSNQLLKEMQQGSDGNDKGLKIKENEFIKILGLTWNRQRDEFQYSVTLPPMKTPATKRNVISDIARLFDPIGWLSPTVIVAKVMIQKLWLTGLSWDESIPSNLLNEWCTYREELSLLTSIRIPRWLGTRDNNRLVELHGFCDASKMAYAAVVYIRVVDNTGNVTVTLVTAKTKVAPIKQISIPRLELCGAVLLARLLGELSVLLKIDKRSVHAWTDSTIVLAWLNGHPNKWKTFVANRVSEILTTLDSDQWSHVTSKHNPADCASRGVRPSELVNTHIWLNGPEFLKRNSIRYDKPKNIITDLEQVKVFHTEVYTDIWDRFSSLTKLVRVVAYCRRFLSLKKQVKDRHCSSYLTSQEIKAATDTCIRQCQVQHFGEEIKALETGRQIEKGSKLKSLNPFLDQQHILRVGGRLENAQLSHNRKHPILIPKASALTTLIVSDAHLKTLHGGTQLMLNYINSKYWILGARDTIKANLRKCVTCVRQKASTPNQLMGQLPQARVTPTRPFKSCGVDYAGPIQLRTSRGRGHKAYKGYICLFICMATRAIHLEVVCDLTTKGFLQAFKRMVARRGHCEEMWSDNGKNFVGASNELKLMFNSEKSSFLTEIAGSLATNGTTWHFIPPHAPNFGGLWESGIRSTKYHLKRVIGESTLTFEEMSTVLAQIEACLNSRPLSRMDNDPDNLNVLTPGHWLIGEPIVTVPDENFANTNVGSLRRWQLTQRMVQDFWRRWSREYLVKYLHRYKWANKTPEPNVNDVVLVKEDDLPPSRWLFGRVVEKHPGADGITRVVTLRTKSSIIKRPTSKLCILPVNE